MWGYDSGGVKDYPIRLTAPASGMSFKEEDAMKWRTCVAMGLALALSACGGGAAGGLVTTNPSADQVQGLRVFTVRVADATMAGMTVLNEGGVLINQLPLDAKTKNTYDCAILKAVGTTKPASDVVVKTCGPIPLTAAAPIPRALTELKNVTACPGLTTTLTSLKGSVDPLIAMFDKSDQIGVRMAGISLRATFAILTLGDRPCQ